MISTTNVHLIITEANAIHTVKKSTTITFASITLRMSSSALLQLPVPVHAQPIGALQQHTIKRECVCAIIEHALASQRTITELLAERTGACATMAPAQLFP